jgi:hypothetical protein
LTSQETSAHDKRACLSSSASPSRRHTKQLIETIDACFRDVRLLRDQSGDHIGPAGSSLRSPPPEKTKKRPRQRRGPRQNVGLEWYVSRFSLGAGSDCWRLLRSTIQLANYVRSDLPRREFDARGFLAFADFPLVAAAQKQARNKHSIASARGGTASFMRLKQTTRCQSVFNCHSP